MDQTSYQKAQRFRALHESGKIFLMPNAWNAGSAALLEEAGFSAIATTSAGIAFNLGLPDYQSALGLDEALFETRRIASQVDLPVSADAENGYGHEPESVAVNLLKFAETGVVGAGIEDYSGDAGMGLYDRGLATERIRAARAAADSLAFPFTLTARAECYLTSHAQPFEESVARANAYREAGADCLFVPGVRDAETIAALVREIDGPLSVVMGLSGNPLSLGQLADLGVMRVSVGGSLARATLGLIRRSAEEIITEGSFNYAEGQIPDAELCELFSARAERRNRDK